MNDSQAERLLTLLGTITASLERIATGDQDPEAVPEWTYPIENFATFNWELHNIAILASDQDGPTVVQWQGKAYKRRSPENAYGAAIWYSRCTGKDTEDRNKYAKLLIFKPIADKIRPVSREVEKIIAAAPKPTPATPEPAPPQPEPKPSRTTDAELTAEFDALPSASATVTERAAAARAERAPAANGKARPAAVLVGVTTEFRNWSAGFATRYPHYRINSKDTSADLYHVLKTAGHLGIAQITTANLAATCAALEAHAQVAAEPPATDSQPAS